MAENPEFTKLLRALLPEFGMFHTYLFEYGVFQSVTYSFGIAKYQKILGFIPWYSKVIAEINARPKFDDSNQTWSGVFKVRAYREKECDAFIQSLKSKGIECEVEVRPI